MDLGVKVKNKPSNKFKKPMKWEKQFKYNWKFFLFLLVFYTATNTYNAQRDIAFKDREFASLLINGTGAKISGDLYTADSLYK